MKHEEQITTGKKLRSQSYRTSPAMIETKIKEKLYQPRDIVFFKISLHRRRARKQFKYFNKYTLITL